MIGLGVAAAGLAVVALGCAVGGWCDGAPPPALVATEPAPVPAPVVEVVPIDPCTPPGPGSDPVELFDRGMVLRVVAPAGYDPTVAHPLIMIFAPAGMTPAASERFAEELVVPAGAAGYVLAFAGHMDVGPGSVMQAGGAAAIVAERWCIDRQRVFLVGHSDGGTLVEAVVFLGGDSIPAAAVVASASGMRGSDLRAVDCPAPRPAMIIHSDDDELFPGFGGDVAKRWAVCNRCASSIAGPDRGDGCRTFPGCPADAQLLFCPVAGRHGRWPGMTETILRFFAEAGGATAPAAPASN